MSKAWFWVWLAVTVFWGMIVAFAAAMQFTQESGLVAISVWGLLVSALLVIIPSALLYVLMRLIGWGYRKAATKEVSGQESH